MIKTVKKTKQSARVRRRGKTKARLKFSDRPSLIVFRSNVHIYAQLVVHDAKGDTVLASASTVEKEIKEIKDLGNKVAQAAKVGHLLAERAKKKKVTKIAFDRSGYKYHGRVKALADAARAAGLNF